MEAAIRFSKNSLPGEEEQRFLHVDVTGKSFRLCNITKASKRKVRYETISASTKSPAFRAFDWHPVRESLVAVGGSGGDATLLNIAEGQQDSLSFSIRSQRLCNAVALSPENLIAVGLDRVRTDFCLNIWDFNQRLAPTSANRNSTKGYSEPVHKLAGGEPITSLRFFNRDPQLLVTGVKGQYVRLYDLREPASGNGLQFATRCVHNLAIDTKDENFFASCYSANEQMVCLWDRRMSSRAYAGHGVFSGNTQPQEQPEPSMVVTDITDSPGTIWTLRFSKSRRGCLGVLLSSGHLRVYDIEKDFVPEKLAVEDYSHEGNRSVAQPQDVYLNSMQDVERAYVQDRRSKGEKKRIVSFDFTTGNTKTGQPKLLLLTGEGDLRMAALRDDPEPTAFSSAGYVCKGSAFEMTPAVEPAANRIATALNKIRRAAEPRNALKVAFKQSKHGKNTAKDRQSDLRRMSSFANQSWNSDLGFYEKEVPLHDLLMLVAAPRLRCEAGYLLDANKNKSVAADSQWTESLWNWIDLAERISRNNLMTQDNLDLSFMGVHGIWMEEVTSELRQRGNTFTSPSLVVKNLSNRLNLPARKGCETQFPWHRKVCLHVAGVGWSRKELETTVQRNVDSRQHTKAAAIAIFAEEEKLAFKALRSKTATQSHKMLAMAIAGGSRRAKRGHHASSQPKDESDDEDDTDWTETITSLSSDLTDPYARAILAYVKTGDWEDVLNEESLPLKHRVGVALRHLSDSELTEFIGRMTREVVATGDIEGVVLTGTGTREGLELLQSYARIFNDLQTAVLGLFVGGAAGRFLAITSSSSTDDRFTARKVEAMREIYRSNIMSWGLKFDRVRFDVAYSRALSTNTTTSSFTSLGRSSSGYTSSFNRPHPLVPKPKEQIRLICTYCSQSLTQFSPDAPSSGNTNGHRYSHTHQHNSSIATMSTQLTAEKAAVVGTVCPRCGRHLPRCGVCDLWLGMPDETFSKWYTDSVAAANNAAGGGGEDGTNSKTTSAPYQRNTPTKGTKNKLDLPQTSSSSPAGGTPRRLSPNPSGRTRDREKDATDTESMAASIITTIGPSTSTNTSQKTKSNDNLLTLVNNNKNTISTDTDTADNNDNGNNVTPVQSREQQLHEERLSRDRRWKEVMHKFTIFCVNCSHGFHAQHAKMWFEGDVSSAGFDSDFAGDGDGVGVGSVNKGHRTCPVAGCGCHCNG